MLRGHKNRNLTGRSKKEGFLHLEKNPPCVRIKLNRGSWEQPRSLGSRKVEGHCPRGWGLETSIPLTPYRPHPAPNKNHNNHSNKE